MISRLKTLLAVFQSSHYDTELFWAWIRRHPKPTDWDKFQDKVKADWTLKAKILFVASITFSQAIPFALILNFKFLRRGEGIAIKWIALRAKKRLQKTKFRMIIGITGSFGKTTTKEIIAQILGEKFRVHKTPENVNTLLGVAGWINQTHFQDGDILIAEMGAYRKGDIAALCSMIQPTVGILTGLNEAHRERFGSLEETAATKCELFDALPSGGMALWNADSEALADAIGARQARWETRGLALAYYRRDGNRDWHLQCRVQGETNIEIELVSKQRQGETAKEMIRFLGIHLALPLSAAFYVADELGLSTGDIARSFKTIRPLDRRLNPRYASGNRLLIDDSYNITLDGVEAALEVLKKIIRRKIGVFAGIPEGGKESDRINEELGRKIASAFEIILLGKTPVAEAVARGLKEDGFTPHLLSADEVKRGAQPTKSAGFNESRIIRYTDGKEVENILAQVAQDGDCIYFSAYDWPVIYL